MSFRRFFHPGYAPVYVPAVLSLAGTLVFMGGARAVLSGLVGNHWSPLYFLATPFLHSGPMHFLLNMMALHFIGGHMLLPLLGARRFVALLAIGAVMGNVVNNIMSEWPLTIGFSTAIMALLGAALFPYARAGMKLLFIHDLLRLPPFEFRYIVAFVAALDVAGIVFGWGFFAHWAHLGGLASGALFGYLRFVRRVF